MELSLLKYFLPSGLLDHFEVVNLDTGSSIIVHLDEKNIAPKGKGLTSKGFREAVTLQDFPMRDKALYLRIRRRKWIEESTGKTVSNHWDLSAEGTRMTKELADFLKERPGYYTG